MSAAFVPVLAISPVSGEPVDIAVSIHKTMQEYATIATEQKIPGNCYLVDKVIHQDSNETPAGLQNNSVVGTRFHSYMPAMTGIYSPLNL